jgi:sterol desaturase/sphingolipid hydroxylase (fatty acid hydroxylase superfamily)
LGAALAWAAYPLVVGGALALHGFLHGSGVAVQLSASLAAAVGVASIVLLERWRPYRSSWRTTRAELKTDLVYLAGVQVLLPAALALGVGTALARLPAVAVIATAAPWPHASSIAAQFLLMLAMADAAKYGLHVAAHRCAPLWRLHAVHHTPRKLYALNVTRFHPLERAFQYLLETLPFVLIGVDGQVLALYVVFHSVHGFFQHANVAVRLGALNYLISGPELHRWHHSRRPVESRANYGNHLTLWDLLFGTYAWPKRRQVGALGVDGDPALEFRASRTWRDRALNGLMRLRMLAISWRDWRPLAAAARDPGTTQRALLRRILVAQRDTEFGQRHGFASIAAYEEYRRRVPLQTYESLRPYIERQERTRRPCLNVEQPLMYAQTSGTTGAPKYIPVTRRALKQHKHGQNLSSYLLYRAVPDAYDGRILAIVAPAVEGRLDTGTPFGSASGHMYASMPRLTRRKYVVPPEVFAIPDYDLKYLVILRLALAERGITAMGAANPSTFLHLLEVLHAHRDELLADLAAHRIARAGELPAAVRQALAPRLGCTPARLAELRAILAHDHLRFADLWPELALVTTWTGGSCAVALARLRAALPEHTRVVDLGYLASELRGSVTLDAHNRGLPALTETFFEFVERDRWEREGAEVLTLDQLEVDREYYVIVTTATGLYRYVMNDIVRVTGRFHATPTIAFVQKGKGVTSITGEKLYESQVLAAVRQSEAAVGGAARFFVMLADVERATYRLLVETDAVFSPDPQRLAACIDDALRTHNLEYDQKRASGRLAPVVATRMREGFADAYKRWCVARGQREGQFKTVALQYASDFAFDYAGYVRDAGAEVIQ